MAHRFHPMSAEQLGAWIHGELQRDHSVFGIPRALFFTPMASDPFRRTIWRRPVEAPFGVAAGPHTQMAQNIVVAWLCGARVIELKTVQSQDAIQIPKPCIDMQDAGYDVEGAQELTLEESYGEYLRAWVLIHALHRQLGFHGPTSGVVFNLSVGCDAQGIRQPNLQRFLDRLRDPGADLAHEVERQARWFPGLRTAPVPAGIAPSVTLSIAHGCPAEEIERAATHLMAERGLHTAVKLNATLLGHDIITDLLHRRLGYHDLRVPASAFAHDLPYGEAVELLHRLRAVAERSKLEFGAKVSSSLPVENHRHVFDAHQKTMHLSGRPLHALAVQLAHRLSVEFDGMLDLSFSGGADAFNVSSLLAAGMTSITSCSDLLRTGGCTRLGQYFENTRAAMQAVRARNLDEYICRRAAPLPGEAESRRRAECALANLRAYAEQVLESRFYRRDTFARGRTKTARPLGLFDCIQAPCTDECPVDQRVPRYMQLVREDRVDEAVALTREDNPLAAILGRACHHPCEAVCIRTHYDEPLAIREIKRYIMNHETAPRLSRKMAQRTAKVAIVGAGPCGLSAAFFLAGAGYPVTIFEAQAQAGGVPAEVVPDYRAHASVIEQDVKSALAQGAEIRFGQQAGRDFTLAQLREQGFAFIVVAAGATQGRKLGIPGEDADGVLDALSFLRAVREGSPPLLGARVGVVGGGDMAMDCARSAWRLGASEVTVIFRHSREHMTVLQDEWRAMEEEGIPFRELVAPKEVLVQDGHMVALRCARMALGEVDTAGRRVPAEVLGEEETLHLDNLIVATSQHADLDVFHGEAPDVTAAGFIEVDEATLETSLPGVYAGGDVIMGGPATIVKAAGDGKRIAHSIRHKVEGINGRPPVGHIFDRTDLLRRRSRRQFRDRLPEVPAALRRNFAEVWPMLSPARARHEAARCLDCDVYCSYCAGVCPNLAIFTYHLPRLGLKLEELQVVEGRVEIGAARPFGLAQHHQVAVIADLCNECGNCTTFCPTAGRPHVDKPRFYLTREEFESQVDHAFLLDRTGGQWKLQGRFAGETHELTFGATAVYESPRLRVVLDPKTLVVREATARAGAAGRQPMEPCGVLYALLVGVRESAPWLPAAVAAVP